MSTRKNVGQILIDKAKQINPNYAADGFNDMGEALSIILENLNQGSSSSAGPKGLAAETVRTVTPFSENSIETYADANALKIIADNEMELINTQLQAHEIVMNQLYPISSPQGEYLEEINSGEIFYQNRVDDTTIIAQLITNYDDTGDDIFTEAVMIMLTPLEFNSIANDMVVMAGYGCMYINGVLTSAKKIFFTNPEIIQNPSLISDDLAITADDNVHMSYEELLLMQGGNESEAQSSWSDMLALGNALADKQLTNWSAAPIGSGTQLTIVNEENDGVTLKTINGQSLVGSGDIKIQTNPTIVVTPNPDGWKGQLSYNMNNGTWSTTGDASQITDNLGRIWYKVENESPQVTGTWDKNNMPEEITLHMAEADFLGVNMEIDCKLRCTHKQVYTASADIGMNTATAYSYASMDPSYGGFLTTHNFIVDVIFGTDVDTGEPVIDTTISQYAPKK